ncbi:MAG TPA: methyltransferase domain-containing protein [Candidatus Binatia bacterium]
MKPTMAAEVRMGELTADFGKTAADYGKHRAGFPPELFDRLAAMDIVRGGMRTLDLGTGTGTIARSLAQRGCESIGLDRSAPLMDEARRIDREAGVTVRYIEAAAEATGFSEASFDLVIAGQCWFWFDRPRAAREARRIVKPGGHLAIAYFDWIPLPVNVAELTEKLIEKHNPKWKLGGGMGIHPRCLADMALAGFHSLETFSFDLDVPYSHEAWRGRIRASAGIGASLSAEEVAAFDRDLQALLSEKFPQEPLAVLHRVFAAIGRAPQ